METYLFTTFNKRGFSPAKLDALAKILNSNSFMQLKDDHFRVVLPLTCQNKVEPLNVDEAKEKLKESREIYQSNCRLDQTKGSSEVIWKKGAKTLEIILSPFYATCSLKFNKEVIIKSIESRPEVINGQVLFFKSGWLNQLDLKSLESVGFKNKQLKFLYPAGEKRGNLPLMDKNGGLWTVENNVVLHNGRPIINPSRDQKDFKLDNAIVQPKFAYVVYRSSDINGKTIVNVKLSKLGPKKKLIELQGKEMKVIGMKKFCPGVSLFAVFEYPILHWWLLSNTSISSHQKTDVSKILSPEFDVSQVCLATDHQSIECIFERYEPPEYDSHRHDTKDSRLLQPAP